jgi:predicted PurR-regulated permease PerM
VGEKNNNMHTITASGLSTNDNSESAGTADPYKLQDTNQATVEALSNAVEAPEPPAFAALAAENTAEREANSLPAITQNFRGVAIGIIAIAATIWLLKFSEDVVVPILLGLILSYSLRPFVDWLQRVVHVPRAIAAAVLLVALFGGVGAGLWNLRADVTEVATELPKAARMLREFIGTSKIGSTSLMGDIRRAAAEIDQASAALSMDQAQPRKATGGNVQVPAGSDYRQIGLTEKIQSIVIERVGSLVGVVTTLGIAGILAFLLLCAGSEHRKKLLQIVGQSLARKKITLTILNEIHAQVQYYLAATAATNIALGLATWALFAYFGIERAYLWGIFACLLHFIPYLGTGLFFGVCFLIGLVSLNSFWPAVYLSMMWMVIQFLIGFGLGTYIQSRSSRINSATLFIGFLLFGWLWGGWGLIVAAPVLAALKAVTDRVAGLKDVSTLMS